MLLSILQFAAEGGAPTFNLEVFGAFGVCLAFGFWILKDVMKQRDDARAVVEQQSKTLSNIDNVLTSVQGTFEGFEKALVSLVETIDRIPPEVELTALRKTMQEIQAVIGVLKPKE